VPGTTDCSGNSLQTCTAAGSLVTADCAPQTCGAGACDGGAFCCIGVCVAGTTTCPDTSHYELCGSNGQYGAPIPCVNQTCVNNASGGACIGTCAPGQLGCDAATNSPTTCGANGTPVDTTPCTNKTCVGTACAGSCAPGQSTCNGSTVLGCDATGNFTVPEATCTGADAVCIVENNHGVCVACQTVHSDGLGQNYYDCNAKGTVDAGATYNSQMALEACTAYATAQGDTNAAADCVDQYFICESGSTSCTTDGDSCTKSSSCCSGICSGGTCAFAPIMVCWTSNGSKNCFNDENCTCKSYCWQYGDGVYETAGDVVACTACNVASATWN
jgi:hypothetical protein